MVAPRLLFAGPNGQSSIRVVFDQPMRQGGSTDPTVTSNWSVTGLPSIQEVLRTSNVEFELLLSSPAPVAGGYSVTVATTVESAAGEVMDPAFVTSAPFAVAVPDLVVSSLVWTSDTTLDIVFSEPIASIQFDAYTDVVMFTSEEDLAFEPSVIGLSQSGAVYTVTLSTAGTSGALYKVALNRDVFVSLANNTQLLAGQETQLTYGQGSKPTVSGLVILEDKFSVSSSEVFGTPNNPVGWPLSHVLYAVDQGSLGPSTPLALGSLESILEAPGASFSGLSGSNVTFEVQTDVRTVQTGQSFLQQSDSQVGAGNETVGATTVLNKTAGDPFEIVFSSGERVFSDAGRELRASMSFSFNPSVNEFPLLALTYLNTQVSVIIHKTASNMAKVLIYKGNKKVTQPGFHSLEFDPTVAFDLSILDATGDGGWLSVSIDGVVVAGASSSTLSDPSIEDSSIGQNSIALTLGSPLAPAEVFSVDFTANIVSETYLSTGFLGMDSRDLLSFSGRSQTVVVGAASVSPVTPGYQGTGKAAFGVSAVYFESRDAIQVSVGVSDAMIGRSFTGSVTLLTVDGNPVDQALMDNSYLLDQYNEVLVIFLHPKVSIPSKVSVAINVDAVDYVAEVPVACEGSESVNTALSQQPPSWFHRPLSNAVDNVTDGRFGPAVIIH